MIPGVAGLESRRLLTAPVIDPIAAASVPVGKSLLVPITASDPVGSPLSYSVKVNGSAVAATVLPGATYLKLSVANYGDMTFQLLPQYAPNTVLTLTTLVEKGFYNGLTIHRVVPDFVIQGGDPNGDGMGGPGFQYDDEFAPDAIFSGNGQLANANTGKDTNGSQFFVTVGPQRSLDFNYTIWGQLLRGFDVLNAIDHAPGTSKTVSTPNPKVVITSASLVQDLTDTVLLLKAPVAGTATVQVTATNLYGESGTQTFTATSAADTINDPPILGPLGNLTAEAGLPIQASLTSTDLEGDSVGYASVLNPATTSASVKVSGNVLTVTPAAGFTGSVTALVGVAQVNSSGTATSRYDTQSISVQFKNQAITAAARPAGPIVAGGTFTGALATFTTVFPRVASRFQATIQWGDGTTMPGTVSRQDDGSYVVAGSKSYARFGTYATSVRIVDMDSPVMASTTVNGQIAVADAALAAQVLALSPQAGTRSVQGPIAVVASANPMQSPGDLAATIDWGDGTTTVGVINQAANGAILIYGSKTYAASGRYVVRVLIASVGGQTATASGSVDLTNRAPALAAIADQGLPLGSTLALQASATDPDPGQALTYTLADGAPSGATINPSTGLVSWVPSAPGTTTFTGVASDDGSPALSAARTFSVTVSDVPPVVNLGGNAALTQFDTLTRSGMVSPRVGGPGTATVDYGDGSGTQPLALSPDGTFALAHSYRDAGTYSVRVVVTDAFGGSGTAGFAATVTSRPATTIAGSSVMLKKGAVSAITLKVNGSLIANDTSGVGHYAIVLPGKKTKAGVTEKVSYPFASASYDAERGTITLRPARKLSLTAATQLRVSGLHDGYGRTLVTVTGKVSKKGIAI